MYIAGELLKNVPVKVLQGSADWKNREVSALCQNTAKAQKGSLFVCIRGARYDAHEHLPEVAELIGANGVILVQEEFKPEELPEGVTVLAAEDTRLAWSLLNKAYYGDPLRDMKIVIGVTGSKGKTTVTHMIAGILEAAGFRTGTIGTNGAIFEGSMTSLPNSTPDASLIWSHLADMAKAGAEAVVIECSSQGLMQHRVGGIVFDYGVFTNISMGDHIGPNEHSSFENYLYCKSMLLSASRNAVVYGEEPYLPTLREMVEDDEDKNWIFYGRDEDDEYYAYDEERTFENGVPGLKFMVKEAMASELSGEDKSFSVCVNLPGEFNVTNAMAAISIARDIGIDPEAINEGLTHLAISGRFDIVFHNEKFSVCVDFAHNGYSTQNHLEAVREYHPKRVVCIFGADGNRSIDRRTGMGEASGRLADLSIITSGHNRYETFEQILVDIKRGIEPTGGKYLVIKDRKEAIRWAIAHAEEGDFITILGLGHEDYQEENGVKTPYSDRDFVLSVIRELGINN